MAPIVLQAVDALLVTNPTNIRYLTGFVGAAPEEREAYVLLTQSTIYLFANALYIESANKLSNNPIIQFSNNPIKVVETSREEPFAKKLKEILNLTRTRRLGFEEIDLTVAEYNKLRKELKGVVLVPTKNRIEQLRIIKRADEIENIRQAAKLTDESFDFVLDKLKPGVSESQIAWEIESYFHTRGAALAFSPIVAFGKNTSQPHYQPKFSLKRSHLFRLQAQDIALLDFGARVNGYCSDMTRVVFIGDPTKEWVRAYKTVNQASHAVIDELKDMALALAAQGKQFHHSGASLDRFARAIIKKAGFPPYPHSLGHNVGLDIHEGPRLSIKKDPSASAGQVLLKPGMIFSVEPAIYVEGKYGIRIEDLVLLKKDGIEILTKSPKKMIIL